ncbi:restriction endonuclease subunit S [Hyphomonas sp.]|uniref:restriction endonuclease subunit S n=1 Tax=Hyphomonas sp. TaxID=87 RepID=UPI003002F2F9
MEGDGVKVRVPALRFSGFEGEWQLTNLSALVDQERKITYGIVQPGEFVDEGIPLVRGGDYSGSWAKLEDIKRVTIEIDAPYKRSKLKPGDLLLTIVGANTGNVAVVPDWLDGANITQTTARIAVASKVANPNIVKQILESEIGKREVYRYIKGAAQPGLNLSDVERFQFDLPVNANEQKKIADFLGALDAKLAALREKEAELTRFKRGLMQALFSQTLRFTRDDGSNFPDWEETRLGRIAEIVGGGTPDTCDKLSWNGNIPWFTPTEIKAKYLGESRRKITKAGLETSAAKMLPVGALLLSTRATVGDVGIATQPACTNQGFQSLVVRDPNYNEFWYYWLKFNTKELLRRASGSTFLEISKTEVAKIPVLSPHYEEQEKIAEALSAIDAKIATVSDQITQLTAFKKGLLQQMFV